MSSLVGGPSVVGGLGPGTPWSSLIRPWTGLSAHRHTDRQKLKQYVRQFHSVHLADIINIRNKNNFMKSISSRKYQNYRLLCHTRWRKNRVTGQLTNACSLKPFYV